MDCQGHPENVVSRDELLDDIMMYWLNGTGASSARLYWESFGGAAGNSIPVNVPMGVDFPQRDFSHKPAFRKRFTRTSSSGATKIMAVILPRLNNPTCLSVKSETALL